ncbi:MAG: hypothetical protein Kow00104_16060 [Rhodothalassiaceae bacterium]
MIRLDFQQQLPPVSPGETARTTTPVRSDAAGLSNESPAQQSAAITPSATDIVASRSLERLQGAAASRGSLEAVVEQTINDLIGERIGTRRLRIEQDEGSGRLVYQSVDRETGEVVGQFPPETILKLIAFIRETEGIVLDTNV